jgi:hypothetical protein
VAEKNSWPFPLLSYVQGDAISLDVVLLEQGAVGASTTARVSHLTQQHASTNGSPSREESAARNRWPRTQICFAVCCDGRHAVLGADFKVFHPASARTSTARYIRRRSEKPNLR